MGCFFSLWGYLTEGGYGSWRWGGGGLWWTTSRTSATSWGCADLGGVLVALGVRWTSRDSGLWVRFTPRTSLRSFNTVRFAQPVSQILYLVCAVSDFGEKISACTFCRYDKLTQKYRIECLLTPPTKEVKYFWHPHTFWFGEGTPCLTILDTWDALASFCLGVVWCAKCMGLVW